MRSTGIDNHLTHQLKHKGWTVRDAAEYLGVSRQRLYAVFDDHNRPRLWNCAIAGMPECTDAIRQELAQKRKNKPKVSRTRTAHTHTNRLPFAVGDGVFSLVEIDIAHEGASGWIVGITGQGKDCFIEVSMPDGNDTFSIDDFEDFFQGNGRKQIACDGI